MVFAYILSAPLAAMTMFFKWKVQLMQTLRASILILTILASSLCYSDGGDGIPKVVLDSKYTFIEDAIQNGDKAKISAIETFFNELEKMLGAEYGSVISSDDFTQTMDKMESAYKEDDGTYSELRKIAEAKQGVEDFLTEEGVTPTRKDMSTLFKPLVSAGAFSSKLETSAAKLYKSLYETVIKNQGDNKKITSELFKLVYVGDEVDEQVLRLAHNVDKSKKEFVDFLLEHNNSQVLFNMSSELFNKRISIIEYIKDNFSNQEMVDVVDAQIVLKTYGKIDGTTEDAIQKIRNTYKKPSSLADIREEVVNDISSAYASSDKTNEEIFAELQTKFGLDTKIETPVKKGTNKKTKNKEMVTAVSLDGKKISFYVPEQAGEAVFYLDGEEIKGMSEPLSELAEKLTQKGIFSCWTLGVEDPARYIVKHDGLNYLFTTGASLSAEQTFIGSIVFGTAPEKIKITDEKITELVYNIFKNQKDLALNNKDMALLEEVLVLQYKEGNLTKGGKTLEISDLKTMVKETVGGEPKDLFTAKYVRKSKAAESEIIKEEFMKFMGGEKQKRKYTKRKSKTEQVEEPVVVEEKGSVDGSSKDQGVVELELDEPKSDVNTADSRISSLITRINEVRLQVLADNKTPGGSISSPLHTGLNLSFDRLIAVLSSGKLKPELIESILAMSKKLHAQIIIKNIGIIINRLYSERGTNPDAEGQFIEKLNEFVDKPEKILDVIKQVTVIRDILKEQSAGSSSIVLSASINLILEEMDDVLNPKEKKEIKVVVTKPDVNVSVPEVKLSTKDKENARLEEVKTALNIKEELNSVVSEVVLRSRAGKYITGKDIESLKGVLSTDDILKLIDKDLLVIGDKRANELYLDHMKEGYLDDEELKKEVQSYLDANPKAIKMDHKEFKAQIESIIDAKEKDISESANDAEAETKKSEIKIKNAESILGTLSQEQKELLILAEEDYDLRGSTFTLEQLAKLVENNIIAKKADYTPTVEENAEGEKKEVTGTEALNIVSNKLSNSSIDLKKSTSSALKTAYDKLLEERSSMTKAEFDDYNDKKSLGFKSNEYDLSKIEKNGFRVLHEPMPGPNLGNYRAIYLYNEEVGLMYFFGVYEMPAKKRTGGHDYKKFFRVRSRELIELVERLSAKIGTTYKLQYKAEVNPEPQSSSADVKVNTTDVDVSATNTQQVITQDKPVDNKTTEIKMNDLAGVKKAIKTNGKLSLLQIKELFEGGLFIKLIADAEKNTDITASMKAMMYIEELLGTLAPEAGKYKLTEAQIVTRKSLYESEFAEAYINVSGVFQLGKNFTSCKASAVELTGMEMSTDNNTILEKAVDKMLEDISVHKGRMSEEVIGNLMKSGEGSLAFFELFSKQPLIVSFCSYFRQAVVVDSDGKYRVNYADKIKKEAYDQSKLKLKEFKALRIVK
jgi:hypothetical protein